MARRTAGSPELMAAVSDRADRGPCAFTLLVPGAPEAAHRMAGPQDGAAVASHARLDAVLPLLSAAAGQDVQGVVGGGDPLAAVRDAMNLLGFDEVIISLLPAPASDWLRLDLPRRIHALGVPVTTVTSAGHVTGPEPALA